MALKMLVRFVLQRSTRCGAGPADVREFVPFRFGKTKKQFSILKIEVKSTGPPGMSQNYRYSGRHVALHGLVFMFDCVKNSRL